MRKILLSWGGGLPPPQTQPPSQNNRFQSPALFALKYIEIDWQLDSAQTCILVVCITVTFRKWL